MIIKHPKNSDYAKTIQSLEPLAKQIFAHQQSRRHLDLTSLWGGCDANAIPRNITIGSARSIGTLNYSDFYSSELSDIAAATGATEVRNAVFFPPSSCMPWHTNNNAPGTRLYITYSQGGIFRYLDEKGKVVDDQDKQGWQVRQFAVDAHSWHCVMAQGMRLSFGFALPEVAA